MKNMDELKLYKENNNIDFLRFKNNKVNINEEIGNESRAVITFNRPISLQEINNILDTYNCKLKSYEAKFVDDDNDWFTFYSSRLNYDKMKIIAENLAQDCDEKNIRFVGITSAEFYININDGTYNSLYENELIFLIDMSDYIIKSSSSNTDIKVIVPDYYYYLETYN